MLEDDFILNAARTRLSEKNISNLREISCTDIKWDFLVDKAFKHGVSTFIYYAIKNHELTGIIPQNIYARLQAYYYCTAVKNSILLEELNRICKIIKCKVILLKGIALINDLYPNIALRSMFDVDILVEKDKAIEIWEMLQRNEFVVPPNFIYKSSVHRIVNDEKHLPPLNSEKVQIEVHWNLFGGNKLYRITKEAWNNAKRFRDNIYQLSDEMMLIHLCSHFYYHIRTSGAGLRMVCDINELILVHAETLNWKNIYKRCACSRLKSELTIALTYAHVLLKTPVPAFFINKKLENSISLDSLAKGRSDFQQGVFSRYFSNLNSIRKPSEFITFVLRTFIPVNNWMEAKYETDTNNGLRKAYLKYWSYLFNKHFFKKNVQIGN